MKKVATTEYAVEVNDENGFVRQIDVFGTYKEAEEFVNTCEKDILYSGEYLSIVFINYDENGNEIEFGTVC